MSEWSTSLTMSDNPFFKFAVSDRVNVFLDEQKPALENKALVRSDFVPKRARPKDTGYDVRCAEPEGIQLEPFAYFKMRLGIRMFASDGWWVELRPRSGTFWNDHIHALYGVIDETYENELCFVGTFIPNAKTLLTRGNEGNCFIPFGKRIAQIIPVKRQDMDISEINDFEMDVIYKNRNDERGTGGFGSSGQS